MGIEKNLKSLFEFQKFEKNSRLEKIISETENRYATNLSDSDVSNVAAAGDVGLTAENFPDGKLDKPKNDKYHPLGNV